MAARKTTKKTSAKKTPAKKAASGFKTPMKPSAALAAIVGSKPLPRTQVTKKLWAYIKSHKLQSKTDGRMIIPDSKLAKVLGSKQISMMKMTAKVSQHLSK